MIYATYSQQSKSMYICAEMTSKCGEVFKIKIGRTGWNVQGSSLYYTIS